MIWLHSVYEKLKYILAVVYLYEFVKIFTCSKKSFSSGISKNNLVEWVLTFYDFNPAGFLEVKYHLF